MSSQDCLRVPVLLVAVSHGVCSLLLIWPVADAGQGGRSGVASAKNSRAERCPSSFGRVFSLAGAAPFTSWKREQLKEKGKPDLFCRMFSRRVKHSCSTSYVAFTHNSLRFVAVQSSAQSYGQEENLLKLVDR